MLWNMAERTVRRVYGMADNWYAYQVESGHSYSESCPVGIMRIQGCVPSCLYKRGKRKGRPRYDRPVAGTDKVFFVSDEQIAKTMRIYEQDTGNCGECEGAAKVLKSWHHIDGVTYRPCPVCGGTGKATQLPTRAKD